MARYIDADKLLKEFEVDTSKDVMDISDVIFGAVTSIIEKQPTADVVEVKHGEWINGRYNGYNDWKSFKETVYETMCSVCGRYSQEYGRGYCPNCGAKMDGRG